jgi:hypothetical protein
VFNGGAGNDIFNVVVESTGSGNGATTLGALDVLDGKGGVDTLNTASYC